MPRRPFCEFFFRGPVSRLFAFDDFFFDEAGLRLNPAGFFRLTLVFDPELDPELAFDFEAAGAFFAP